jgi:phosphonate transport system substrate-binding protein
MIRTARLITAFALTIVVIMFVLPCISNAEDEFLIGLIPEENIFRAIQKHRPLEAYLSEKLGIKVKFTILSRYGDIVERFIARDMDGAFFGIYTSALAMEKLNVEPIARSVTLDGGTTARGVLFARKDSGIKSLADMEETHAAFVDRATATGFIFAIAYLKKHGITDPESFFAEYSFTGSHESSIFAVLDGKSDIGAAKSRVLERLIANDPIVKEELYIIAKSPDLPDNTLMIKKDIDPELKRKFKETLLKLNRTPEGLKILDNLGIKGFIDASEEDFSEVKELASNAGIDIKE